jgi:DNA polymerase
VFVGEQPGDQEDQAGRPFVGPAGHLLDRALAEAGLDRTKAYVTNAVKHFKFTPRGKRRLHQKPNGSEIKACRWWLERELAAVAPRLVVAMGATAAQAVFGRALPVNANRGRIIDIDDDRRALVTVHPSFLLRLPEEERRAEEFSAFVTDLRLCRPYLR